MRAGLAQHDPSQDGLADAELPAHKRTERDALRDQVAAQLVGIEDDPVVASQRLKDFAFREGYLGGTTRMTRPRPGLVKIAIAFEAPSFDGGYLLQRNHGSARVPGDEDVDNAAAVHHPRNRPPRGWVLPSVTRRAAGPHFVVLMLPAVPLATRAPGGRTPFACKRKAITSQYAWSGRLPGLSNGIARLT